MPSVQLCGADGSHAVPQVAQETCEDDSSIVPAERAECVVSDCRRTDMGVILWVVRCLVSCDGRL
jgi:hypothetical protein